MDQLSDVQRDLKNINDWVELYFYAIFILHAAIRFDFLSVTKYVAGPSSCCCKITSGAAIMNLTIWLPGLFLLGIVSIFACAAFAEGCGRI